MRALLMALLEPIDELRAIEVAGNFTKRMAMLEALKGLPFGAVWDQFCLQQGVPVGVVSDMRFQGGRTRVELRVDPTRSTIAPRR